MKTPSTPIFWSIFFILSLLILSLIAQQYTEPREIVISQQQAEIIGEKIWLNEGAGKFDNLVVWNKGEDFPSLGIGHFIWYPEHVTASFTESFPELITFIANKRDIPPWLKNLRFPPWRNRQEFLRQSNSLLTNNLRRFLQETKAEQTLFMVQRLEKALPKILKSIKNPFAKMHVRENFYHVAMQNNGVYALVDYVNFKGEGISPKERYKNLGWGLAQVLENMDTNNQNVMQAFVNSAERMLSRRVANAPRDESRWLPGWRKRLNTYLEPPTRE